MGPEFLLQEYESSRGMLRDLPDNELLTLVGRLGTEDLVRKAGQDEDADHLHQSIVAGLAVGNRVLRAQGQVLGSSDPRSPN